jgi:4-hydroxy-2-oxoheptanedioate aldolase
MPQEPYAIRKRLAANEATYGVTVYTGSPAVVEILGNWGLDFAFIDAEHTAHDVGVDLEKMIMAAKLSGVSPLVRVAGTIEPDIRKALELGAEGVIVPQVKTADEARTIVRAAKFPPLGRRGGDASVRAAGFAGPNFKWSTYTQSANESTLVIPMAENYEFFDNIDEILEVEGLDIINFGPADYSLSRLIPIDYSMSNKEVDERLDLLIAKCRPKGLKVMAPCIPPNRENAERLIAKGVDMLIMGNDVLFLNQGCRAAREGTIDPIRGAKA